MSPRGVRLRRRRRRRRARRCARTAPAFDRWRIVPRMLRDVSRARHVASSCSAARCRRRSCSRRSACSSWPTARPTLRGRARGARPTGVPMIFSNQASAPMEEVAAMLGDAPRWFQLYWSTPTSSSRASSRAPRRAAARRSSSRSTRRCSAGARATSTSATCRSCAARGSRSTRATRSSRGSLRSRTPTRPSAAADARPSPRCGRSSQLTRALPGPFLADLRSAGPAPRSRRFLEIYSRPSLTWDDLPFLRERTRLPIVLKGILHPDDARRALDAGVDGDRRLQPRRPPGRRRDRDARRAARRRRGGRRPRPGAARQRHPQRRRRLQGARARRDARCCSAAPTSTGWRSPARPACARCCANFMADFDLTMGLAGCGSVAGDHAETLVPAG